MAARYRRGVRRSQHSIPASYTVSSLIVHPDVARSRAQIDALRAQLHALFEERIRIRFDTFPSLRDRYAELFGAQERELQELTLALSERRRMVELFSLKLDRGQKLDARTVELVMKAVRTEFARVRARMQAAFSADRRKEFDDSWRPSAVVEHATAPETATPSTTKRRAEELRDLYRVLAKRLHPDARQVGDGEPRRAYWDLVQRGYQRGDIPLLRTLVHLVEMLGTLDGQAEPDVEIERLRMAVRSERAQLDVLKRDELYQLGDLMNNPDWVADRRARFQADIAQIEQDAAKCDRFLAPILSGQNYAPPEVVRTIWSSFVEDTYINNR